MCIKVIYQDIDGVHRVFLVCIVCTSINGYVQNVQQPCVCFGKGMIR